MIKADLRKCIEGFVKLTDKEWTLIDATFERAVAEKNDFFLTKGEVADKICFVEQGSLYSFMTGEKENLVVQHLFFEGYWFGDLESFFSGEPSKRSILVMEPSAYRYITYTDYVKLCNISPKFERYNNHLIRNGYIRSLQRIDELVLDSAEERYQKFVKHYEKYLQRIPLNVLASYVGVKPQSLSRIRNKIAKKL